ncbi:hypothetical protein NMG60_11013154 [Bertholletia excelsa]
MEDEQCTSPSLKDKLRQTLCLSCCFRNSRRESLVSPTSSDYRPTLVRASSEIRDKCRHLINRIGRNQQRRNTSSADFRYDPLSYSLNFDEADLDEAPLQNFSSRLPSSPPLRPVPEEDNLVAAAVPREITCA